MRLVFLVGSLLCLLPRAARAQDGDGLYGRLDGDTVLSAGLGAGPTAGADVDFALALELRGRYLDAAGVVVATELRPGGTPRLVAAVELRPLFPARFLLGGASGVEVLDLTLESIGFELGAALLPEPALAIGFGLSLPIVPPSVWGRGLWLRFGARHVRAGSGDQGGPDPPVADWVFLAVLTVRVQVDLGLSGREPPRFHPR